MEAFVWVADLGSYSWIWVASPELAIQEGRQITVDELAVHPILTHARDTQTFEEIPTHFRTHATLVPRLVPTSNLSSCLHMTLVGMGVATVPAHMVTQELKRGELTQLDYAWVPDKLQFLARYDADRTPHYVAKAASLAGNIALNYAKERG